MGRQRPDVLAHVPLMGRSLVGDSMVPIWDVMDLLAVSRLPGDGQRRQGTETPAASILKQEKTKVITNLVIVESNLSRGARRNLELCYYKNLLRGRNERTDTSRRSPLSLSSCSLDSTRLDSPGTCCCTHRMVESAQLIWGRNDEILPGSCSDGRLMSKAPRLVEPVRE